MFNIGTQELLTILLVVLLLFGAKRIPELARSFGKGVRDFRNAMHGIEREIHLETLDEEEGADRGGSTRKAKWAPGEAAIPPRVHPPALEAPNVPRGVPDSTPKNPTSEGSLAPPNADASLPEIPEANRPGIDAEGANEPRTGS